MTLAVAGLVVATAVSMPGAFAAGPDEREERTLVGSLAQAHGDDFVRGRSIPGWVLQTTTASYDLQALPAATGQRLKGKKVRVTGRDNGRGRITVARDGATAVVEGAHSGAQVVGAAALPAGARDVAVLLVNFADNPQSPFTSTGVLDVMTNSTTSVDKYYRDATDDQVSLNTSVFGYYTVSRTSTTSCDYAAWGNAARTAATAAGVNLSAYQHVSYLWPRQQVCSWSGMGAHPGSQSWINGANTLRTMAHELGHNLGEHHSSTLRCTDAAGGGAALSANCTANEYGDPFSIMGTGTNLLHASSRQRLGLLSTVDVPMTGGTYTLLASDDATNTGPRLLRVRRSDGTYLAIEFRQPAGPFDPFTTTAPVVNGVSLRIDPGHGRTPTKLLDTVPSTTSFSDAPLLAGRSFTDPLSGATVAVDSVSSSGAGVRVTYPSDTTAPAMVTGLTATVTASAVSLSWTPATDDRGVTAYVITRDGSPVATVTAPSSTFSDTQVTGGTTYGYSVSAVDAAGNTGTPATTTVTIPQAPVTVPAVDTTAPTAPGAPVVSVSKQRQAKITWAASTDAVGVVGYRVSIDGGAPVSVSSTSYRTGRLVSGTHSVAVVGYDAARNTSAASTVSFVVR